MQQFNRRLSRDRISEELSELSEAQIDCLLAVMQRFELIMMLNKDRSDGSEMLEKLYKPIILESLHRFAKETNSFYNATKPYDFFTYYAWEVWTADLFYVIGANH